MIVGLLISLPDGLEAFLIVAVLAACFQVTGQRSARAAVLSAVVLAVIVSIALIVVKSIGVDSPALLWIGLLSAAISLMTITWLVVRVGRARAATIVSFAGLEIAIVVFLSFTVVLREVAEVAAFTAELTVNSGGAALLPGMILGLVLGAGLAIAVYQLLKLLSPGVFRLVGSVALIFAGAAMGSQVATELGSLGRLPRFLAATMWDVNWIIPQNSFIGRFLHAFTGYDATPNIPAVLFYLVYLLIMGIMLRLAHAPETAERVGD